MRYKKRQPQQQQAARQPLYRHGVRVDDPNYVSAAGAGVHGGKDPQRKRPPMDPRYPPARVDQPDLYAYRGPTHWLTSRQSTPLIEQPPARKTFTEEWPNWWIWLIVAGCIIAVCLTLLMVILYVFGELTGESPVYKGYFG